MLDIHLVDDSRSRRDNFELVKRALPPTEESIALVISLILDISVLFEGIRSSEYIGDNRVINNKFGWCQWIDFGWIATKFDNCLAHRGKVDHARHSREVLHDYPCWSELNFGIGLHCRIPLSQRANLGGSDICAIFVAK